MKARIYTHAFGSETGLGPAGWAFTVCEDVALKGDVNMQIGGCTKTDLHTARAMAILQALFWLRDKKIRNYAIYATEPGVIYAPALADKIADMNLLAGSINKINPDVADKYAELNESLAMKAWYNVLNQPNATFNDVEVGDTLLRKKELWSENYVVMAKFDGSKTLTLINLSTITKRASAWTREEFDKDSFIVMK